MRLTEKRGEDELVRRFSRGQIYCGAHRSLIGRVAFEHSAAKEGVSALPMFGTKPVAAVLTEDVLRLLQPIWTELPETASRVRGRVEAILDYSAAQGWRSGDNPARWTGHLDHLLPPRSKVARVVHHPALPWQDLPALMAKLSASNGTAARCLAFLVLTAARSSEAREARWGELDLDAAVWAVPPERMKAGREHRVPLAPQALAILGGDAPLASDQRRFGVPRRPCRSAAVRRRSIEGAAGRRRRGRDGSWLPFELPRLVWRGRGRAAGGGRGSVGAHEPR
jgi:integrase